MTRRYLNEPARKNLGPWVRDAAEEDILETDQAYVTSAKTRCWQCREEIEVIALYCESATLNGDSIDNCSIMHITHVDEALRTQLAAWPFFRPDDGVFCNFCSYCWAPHQDLDLHSKPDGPFFSMSPEARQSMTLTPLTGRFRLKGEEIFEG